MAHHRQVAKEIRDEYIDTMSKIYFSYFKSYLSKLLKLQVYVLLFSCLIRHSAVNALFNASRFQYNYLLLNIMHEVPREDNHLRSTCRCMKYRE